MAKEKGLFADPDRPTREHQEIGMDCLGVIRTLTGENSLRRYRVFTNGPSRQDATYLHFHVEAW